MDNANRPHTELKLKTVTKVPVQWLELDRLNPRLFLSGDLPNEVDIISRLYRSEDLSEMLQSVAANGYLDIEPLVVLREHEKLIVLEGNRRLAAIRLFEEPDLPRKIRQQTGLRVNIPHFPEKFRRTLNEVSVYRVESREDARAFIGFKHINGAARWDSYAKAKYAADWYKKGGTSLEEIARQIGDRHDTIKRMVNAIYVLEQAVSARIFDLSDRVSPRFGFSHLYSALSRAAYMRFLGLEEGWTQFNPEPNPVPEAKLESLRAVLQWLYGSKEKGIDPVIKSQNPDIRLLGEVLESPEALLILEGKGTLAEAHLSTAPANQRFIESLLRARTAVREASNNLRGFDGRDHGLVGIADDISEAAQTMHARMIKKTKDVEADRD